MILVKVALIVPVVLLTSTNTIAGRVNEPLSTFDTWPNDPSGQFFPVVRASSRADFPLDDSLRVLRRAFRQL